LGNRATSFTSDPVDVVLETKSAASAWLANVLSYANSWTDAEKGRVKYA
jgi:hypothetical protein